MRRLLILVVIVAACGGNAAVESSSVTSTVPDAPWGEVLGTEPVDAPDGMVAWRVAYRSQAPDGSATTVSAIVAAPSGTAPAERRPIEAIGLGAVGIADQCAVSRTPDPLLRSDLVAGSIAAGRVLAITDLQGLGTPGVHPFGSGESAAHALLDAARAAGQIDEAHAGSRVVLRGWSQGGHGVLFAAELAPTYAPDLEVVGVASVAPFIDLVTFMHNVSSVSRGLGAALTLVRGLGAAYPEADPSLVLTDRGRAALDDVDSLCVEELSARYASVAPSELFTADPSTVDGWRQVLERNSLGPGRIEMPILLLKGDADEILPKQFTDVFVEKLCEAGDPLDYRVYPGADHIGVLAASAADVETWIDERLRDVPTAPGPVPCRPSAPPPVTATADR